MQQLEMQFFWPLTEQISLDLDYTPCEEYAKKLQEAKWKNSVSAMSGNVLTIGNGGIGSWNTTINTVPVMQFKPEPDAVGYWEINKDLHVWRKARPNWLHQTMTKLFFGWGWKDK
jgi:hypothetical protein